MLFRSERPIESQPEPEPKQKPDVVIEPPPKEPLRTPAAKKKELNDLILEARTETPKDSTEQVLVEIRSLLKVLHRDKTFQEFSAMKLASIALQVLVLFCLLAAIWQKMSPVQDIETVFVALGFAAVFQLMALTLYIMNDRK